MSALTINSVSVPVSENGWRDGTIEIAERGRSVSGSYLGTRRAVKRTFAGTIITTDATEATALRSVINGDGYGWSFGTNLRDDYKGNQGWSTTDASREAGGKFSAGQMSVASGKTTSFTFPTGWPGARWTLSLYRKNGSNWDHWWKVYGTTTLWKNGTGGESLPAWLTFDTSGISLAGDGGAAAKYSEILLWPFLSPTTWPAIFNARSAAAAKPPFFDAAGDYVVLSGTVSYTCRGMAMTSAATNRGALDRLQKIDFSLEET